MFPAPPLYSPWDQEEIRRVVRLSVPRALFSRLQEQMRAAGGDTMPAGSTAADPNHLLLVGTLAAFREFCRRLAAVSGDLQDMVREIAGILHNFENPPKFLDGRNCRLVLDRPRIMGVLNVTPDSFSDGGCHFDPEAALRRGVEMAEEGADLIDIGGESTRPGAPQIGLQEEIDRVLPVIEMLRREIDLPLSIDTTKAAVAVAAVRAGASFINDISGLHFDPEMPEAAAESGAGLFLMHTRGRPDRMQQDTSYGDLLGDILAYLREGLALAAHAGVPAEKLAVDPGIGFGKDADGNLEILRCLGELAALGRPVLIGTSRKGFIGRLLDQPDPARRLPGTLATVSLGVAAGAHLFRVHDVRPAREAAQVAWAVCRQAPLASASK